MAVTIQVGYTNEDPRTLNKSPELGQEFPCRIKGDCDIEKPVFVLNAHNGYINSNYLYCKTWDKYYFITQPPTVSEGGTMELVCEEDYLMSYKDTISNSSQLVTRQENVYNMDLPDTLLPLKQEKDYYGRNFINATPIFTNTMEYVVGIIEEEGETNG